ncbi:MAG TPA: RsmE family RNA methyltransferase [Verrucomicrobiae bacterium]|jgi:16S rRNA (uracil1498-N3)-methyltransferase|nr:RsmE family RNA methyltransferase [Verrucomicrobiae bacterium]
MHRFFIEPEQSRGERINLSEREFHHAGAVLRLKEGERVSALDGAGSELLCVVEKITKRGITLRVTQRNSVPRLPYALTLVQAIPKGKTMELVVQKAAELGAARVVPIVAERTVTHLDEDNAETKVQKWNWVAIDAIKQCGSAWLPTIPPPRTPAQYLASAERSELNLIATLQPDAQHPRVHLRDFQHEKSRKPKTVSVWVGPEGDFTPAEINAVRSAGALPISLGPLILRSETAAIYCLAVLSYELQAESR